MVGDKIMALTKQDIFEVADELSVKGEKVTQLAVREILGSGSFSTIAEALREWKEIQAEEDQLQEAELPKEVEAQLKVFSAAIWKQAQNLATESFSEERIALKRAKEVALLEAEETREVMKVLEEENIEKDSEIDQLKDMGKSLQAKNEVLVNELAEMTKLRDGFYKDFNGMKESLDEVEKLKFEAEQANKHLSLDMKKVEAELIKVKTEAKKTQKAYDGCLSDSKHIKSKLDTLQEAYDNIKGRLAQSEGGLAESRIGYSKLLGKNEVLVDNLDKKAKELEVFKTKLTEKEVANQVQAQKIKQLEEKLKAVEPSKIVAEVVTSAENKKPVNKDSK